jgi:hypothetical protein
MKLSRIMMEWTVLVLLLAFSGAADSQTADSQKSDNTVLVELFTSEGCSSCPPADALLRQIDGQRVRSGQFIVGISEHVTYWNSLGWKDPYSDKEFTQRQEAYARRFHLEDSYTPQMVVNGQEQFVGSDKAALLRALAKQSQPLPLSLRIESMAAQGDTLILGFSLHGAAASKATQVFAVIADDIDQSSVLRGENSGRTLVHVSVARSITPISTLHGSGNSSVKVVLPPRNQGERKQAKYLILFAQATDLGQVEGVTSKPLPLSPETP